ncbi:MAG: glycosyltransferase [Chloroflexi bacterium]|nr:glycosyltransferase [Chloroflexota bacterium]
MYLLDLQPHRIAVIAAHTSPLARLGGDKAGGLNVYVRQTAEELAGLGYPVDIFTRDDGTQPDVVTIAPDVRVIHLEAGPREPLDKDAMWEYLPAFLHSLRSFKERHGLRYQTIHSHYWMSGWAGSYLQRLWDVPHVTMFHTLGEAKNRAREAEHEPPHRIQTERRVIATADAVVAASEHERGLLERLYDADPDRIEVIPCGVDVGTFRPLDRGVCRGRLGLDDGPVLLFVGRLEPLKGVDLLVQTLPLLPLETTLLIAGGDERAAEYVTELQTLARRLGVADQIRFAGSVQPDELPVYYSAADVCAVPSFYESFGLVALESMACGTPVVASRVGGLPATVRDGENGYLIPWRTPESFAEKIGDLLSDPCLHARMSRAARATAERFRWSRVAGELDMLYARLWEARASADCHAVGEPVVTVSEHALCQNG